MAAMQKRVNQRFANTVIDEIGNDRAIVFVQDYHFALLPRLVKEARPDAIVCQFWHIPWPNNEAFRICPWSEEIVDGLLGNDLLGFHIQFHCNNFFDTVDASIEARIDREHFAVVRRGHRTYVKLFPISIDPEPWSKLPKGRTRRRAPDAGPAGAGEAGSFSASIDWTTRRAFPSGSRPSSGCSNTTRNGEAE